MKIAITPTKFIPTQVESWSNLDKDKLNDYTRELEILGFVHLTDYTSPGAQGMGRLFVQPHKFCFAEVGQVGEQPMFCSISCSLSKQWTLGVTNLRVNPNLDAISYAFLRQPRVLVKRFNNETPDTLLQSLLEWRQQALVKLKVEMQQNTTAEAYFEREHQRRILQRQSVFRKSIIWGLLEMLWYSYNPMSEWLGDYNKSNIN